MKVNVNDDAAIETVNTTEGKTAVDGLITALNGTTALKPLAWSAALQNAGKDWIDAVVGSSTIATTVNGSTTASRAAKYGTVGTGGAAVYQSIIGQYDFNGLNAVIYLLVDDGNSKTNRPNRAAILSKDYTQAATSYAASTKLASTSIYSVNFADSKFTANSGISCSNSGTSANTGGSTTTGTKGASELLFVGATTFAALVSALF